MDIATTAVRKLSSWVNHLRLDSIKAEIEHLEGNEAWLQELLDDRAELTSLSMAIEQVKERRALTPRELKELREISEALNNNRATRAPDGYIGDLPYIRACLERRRNKRNELERKLGLVPIPA
jgi:DNA repair exonuclease SbcCD ATPase subunit